MKSTSLIIAEVLTQATVISGFPGIGKSVMTKKFGESVSDSDSSLFSWSSPGVRNPDFPANYIKHIKDVIKTKEYVLVSSHKVARDQMIAEHIPFVLVYPDVSLKEEYLARYSKRGNTPDFIKMMTENFEKFVSECAATNSEYVTHLVLQEGQFLGSPEVLEQIELLHE
jgi:hypothetical protein